MSQFLLNIRKHRSPKFLRKIKKFQNKHNKISPLESTLMCKLEISWITYLYVLHFLDVCYNFVNYYMCACATSYLVHSSFWYDPYNPHTIYKYWVVYMHMWRLRNNFFRQLWIVHSIINFMNQYIDYFTEPKIAFDNTQLYDSNLTKL
jgi:hypothetical protein